MIWAVKRDPAGVWGDGINSIKQLIFEANKNPARGYNSSSTLRPIVYTKESEEILIEQKFTLESVPHESHFVKLRRASNLSSGGTAENVTKKVHQDNKKLAEDAASLINLDLAGIDLIIPDISESWKVSGGAIIEVNAQPQLIASTQDHLYKEILQSKVIGNGRIPILMILDINALDIADKILIELGGDAEEVGIVSRDRTKLGWTEFDYKFKTTYAAGHALLQFNKIQALIFICDESTLTTGLPFDYYNLVYIGPEVEQYSKNSYNKITEMITPHCKDKILVPSELINFFEKRLNHGDLNKLKKIDDMSFLINTFTHYIKSNIRH
jgi:cyanophycin synthetase